MNDTQLLEERLHRLARGPDDADWDDVLHRAEETHAPAATRPPRHRLGLVLAAACVAIAALAVGFSGLLGSSARQASRNQPTATRQTGGPLQFSPIELNFTRGATGITAIDVTVKAATLGGTAQLQVVRGEPDAPASQRQVVYQEQVPLTNLQSPASGPPGTVVLSTWSGTLSPSAWDGGCQNATYVVDVKVSPAAPTSEAQGESAESGSFVCNSS
jgi:hypothetical protein